VNAASTAFEQGGGFGAADQLCRAGRGTTVRRDDLAGRGDDLKNRCADARGP
jgi:hypothetical protein